MALAIILSIFVGLVVSLFFILDHSRRSKAKKAKRRKSQRDNESTKDEEGTYFNSASMIIQSNFLLFFRRLNDLFVSGIIYFDQQAAEKLHLIECITLAFRHSLTFLY